MSWGQREDDSCVPELSFHRVAPQRRIHTFSALPPFLADRIEWSGCKATPRAIRILVIQFSPCCCNQESISYSLEIAAIYRLSTTSFLPERSDKNLHFRKTVVDYLLKLCCFAKTALKKVSKNTALKLSIYTEPVPNCPIFSINNRWNVQTMDGDRKVRRAPISINREGVTINQLFKCALH